LVFTDGEPTSGDPTPMVEAARRDGQIVIGCLFSSDGGHGLDQRMREIFGEDFVSIDSIDRMPRILGARLKQMMRGGSRRR